MNKAEDVLLEKLAELEHQQWSHWINYLKTNFPDAFPLFYPAEIEKWINQANTKYENLMEHEKESDREWARKALAIIQASNLNSP